MEPFYIKESERLIERRALEKKIQSCEKSIKSKGKKIQKINLELTILNENMQNAISKLNNLNNIS